MLFKRRDELDFRQIVDAMPINVMTCRLSDFTIDYVNQSTVDTLSKIEHLLPVKAKNLIGTSIDVFHRKPQHQRQLLSDHRNLPFKTRIALGEEYLDLLVSPIMAGQRYIAPLLTWNLVTEKVKLEAEQARLQQMIDMMPIAIMTCDLEGKINYVNKTSTTTLRQLQSHLPVQADKLLGQSIDIFHKNPMHQKRLLADPANLPHRAKIKLGNETLALNVSAIMDHEGKYIGPMLNWSVETANVAMADGVTKIVGGVNGAATNLNETAQNLSVNAQRTSAQASNVAIATEELSASVSEIARQTNNAAQVAKEAVSASQEAADIAQSLTISAEKIGSVVKMIADIAGQTNLLALNATIEAARAGEAGKGFAVVAGEVKNLASQTAKATDEISSQVQSIQLATTSVVTSIQQIGDKIGTVNEVTSAISAAVEEQNAATQEVARNIADVVSASSETDANVKNLKEAADKLSEDANSLSQQVTTFTQRG